MAYQLATAFVKVGVKGMSTLGSAFSRVASIATGALSTITSMMGAVGSLVGGASVGMMVKLGSDAEEMESMFGAVFKSQTEEAKRFAESLGINLGRSVNDMMGQMAGFQDTFVPLGFAREEATELSKKLVTLTQDLASFKNLDPEEVASSLTSGLIGNHESLMKFGVVIKQATLDQELLNMGIEGGAQAATEQQRALARLNLIMQGTSDAQGDAARTAGGFANRLRGLMGALKDIGADIGKAFLPALSLIAKKLTDLIREIQPFVQKWAKFFATLGEVAVKRWDLTWRILKKSLQVYLNVYKDLFLQLPELMAFAMGKMAKVIVDGFKAMREALKDFSFKDLIFGSDGGDGLFDKIKNKMAKVGNAFGEGVSGGNLSDVLKPSKATLDRIEELKDLSAEFREEMRKTDQMHAEEAKKAAAKQNQGGGQAAVVKRLVVKEFSLPTGFLNFDEANKKIQDALLDQKDPQQKQLQKLDEGNLIAKQIRDGVRQIGNMGGGNSLPVAAT